MLSKKHTHTHTHTHYTRARARGVKYSKNLKYFKIF